MEAMGGTWRERQYQKKSMQDAAPVFEEAVTLKRWSAQTAGAGIDGTPASATYVSIPMTAVIATMTIESIKASNGVYSVGDIEVQSRLEPTYSTNVNGGDLLTWRGVDWRLVQRADSVDLDGTGVWYRCVFRRVTGGG